VLRSPLYRPYLLYKVGQVSGLLHEIYLRCVNDQKRRVVVIEEELVVRLYKVFKVLFLYVPLVILVPL
jgi:hypothetical protein